MGGPGSVADRKGDVRRTGDGCQIRHVGQPGLQIEANSSVVGWSDPEGSRHRIGALLLGYYTPAGDLIYAGRAGTGLPERELERLWQRLQPLVVANMPLSAPPPRGGRFGSPLVLSRLHWVRPEMVVEISYVEWTPDGLLRHTVYLGEREDKAAIDVRRDRPER